MGEKIIPLADHRYAAVVPRLPARLDAPTGLLGDRLGRTIGAYLSTPPSMFGPIAQGLKAAGIACTECRIAMEKPIGHDLASSRQVNEEVGDAFAEDRVFRIDHYLGKETVQNLLALRFANMLFEPLWNAQAIDHVQITVAETVGVEERAAYYDKCKSITRELDRLLKA